MLATAVAQAVVRLIGVGAGLGGDEANWLYDIIGVTAIFCILWLIAAWFFTKAARQGLRVFA